MSKNKVTEIVENLARPIVEDLGLELVDVEYVRESANWYLRVFIDKDGGVTLDDCEAVNGPLGEKLDEVDPIPQSYIFEVSSPGVERPFHQPGILRCDAGEPWRQFADGCYRKLYARPRCMVGDKGKR